MEIINQEQVRTQMRRGVLELCVLSIIAEGDAYTTDLVEHLKRAEMIVVEGSIYPLLSRLKNQNYLAYRWEESQQGPPRKYYSLTAAGRSYLAMLTEAWRSMVESVNSLLVTPEADAQADDGEGQ